MGLIERSDLSLDYDWSTRPGETAVNEDDLSSTVFDKRSGDDVLTVLNKYAEKRESDITDELLKAENLLRNELPKDLDTEDDIADWLWSKIRSNP